MHGCDEDENRPIGSGQFFCHACNGITGFSTGPCGKCQPGRQPTTTAKCALCSTVLYSGPVNDAEAARLEQEHRKVCDRRALDVGEYARWDGDMDDGMQSTHWAEGEIVQVDGNWMQVRVDRSDYITPGFVSNFKGRTSLRRIPRPEQATVDDGQLGKRLVQYGIRTPVGDITMRADPTLRPGEFRWVNLGDAYRDMRRDAAGSSAQVILPDAPTLYDELTAEQCLARYEHLQRESYERFTDGSAIRHGLTPAQLAAAREQWSLALRARIAAAKERARCEVSYCEVDPWE